MPWDSAWFWRPSRTETRKEEDAYVRPSRSAVDGGRVALDLALDLPPVLVAALDGEVLDLDASAPAVENPHVFVGVPQLTPELIRALAKMAGVHLFTEGKATVWAAEGYISLQAHETGPLILNTGRQGQVVDALDGKALGNGPEVTLTLKKGEVRVIKYPSF